MKVGYAEVIENQRLYADTYITWFRAPAVGNGAAPGQFLMLRCDDDPCPTSSDRQQTTDPLLPRPMSYHRVRDGAHGPEWSILYDVVGRGTAWLARRRPGDRVYCWGPLGHGFRVGRSSRNLLLVAGGIGVAPLVWLADDAVAHGLNVTMIVGARDAGRIFPAQLLHPQVEVIVTTDDGSAGRSGFVTQPFAELLPWCDQAFACGPTPMFRALAEVARASNVRRSVQALLEERMACGTGICYGCAVEVRVRGGRATKLVCKDGPRFDLRDVY
ncbi:MAG TPA: dihydroorotate dehydrogenase electron transfer subunit [Dehalococcoidia bacterium]|nr:dihydroorotate dehydrogenase electron transfer subunit [Dehalococcoidia bacterium]